MSMKNRILLILSLLLTGLLAVNNSLYYVRDQHIRDFETWTGPAELIRKTLQNDPNLLDVSVLNPVTFGRSPVRRLNNGREVEPLESRSVLYGGGALGLGEQTAQSAGTRGAGAALPTESRSAQRPHDQHGGALAL